MSGNLSYVQFDEASKQLSEMNKEIIETTIDGLNKTLENSRERSLAITKLEEAFMWIGKAIRDTQIKRTGKEEHLPQRDNS